ncbi:MAG: hypothetical protein LBV72_12390 [Tannerella sp.]|jgi:hypothetical protein|nr:hypothetical protein [Tannerella sp.]
MNVKEIENCFIEIVEPKLKEKGFKYFKTKRWFHRSDKGFDYYYWFCFTRWKDCFSLNSTFFIGYGKVRAIIEQSCGIMSNNILGGSLKSISEFRQNEWSEDFPREIKNRNDCENTAREWLCFVNRLVEPFCESISNINFLFDYTYKPIYRNQRTLLIPPNLENALNVITLAALNGKNFSEFNNIASQCESQPVFESEVYRNKLRQLINYLKLTYYN